MFTQEWTAEYEGHRIVVQNSWGLSSSLKFEGEAKLYIDGIKVDSTTAAFNLGSTPAMRGSVKRRDGSAGELQVFMKSGLLSVKTKICVDGVKIGGDGS